MATGARYECSQREFAATEPNFRSQMAEKASRERTREAFAAKIRLLIVVQLGKREVANRRRASKVLTHACTRNEDSDAG
jgi:hypothetical protein